MSVKPEKSQAACSDEVWARRAPNPHEVKMAHIREGYWESKESEEPPPGSVKQAWRGFMKAIGKWVRALPCRWFFHVPYQKGHPYSGTTYCKRCGAWRGSW